MIAHGSRNADAARRARRLESRRYIYRIAVQITSVWDRVANVDPYAKANGSIRRLVGVVDWNPSCILRAQRTAPSTLSNTSAASRRRSGRCRPPCSSIAGSIRFRRNIGSLWSVRRHPGRSGGCNRPYRHRRRRQLSPIVEAPVRLRPNGSRHPGQSLDRGRSPQRLGR